jgi:hypothetical protein
LVALLHLHVFQLDVNSAFFNRELQEEVYVEQSSKYKLKGKKDKIYRFYKALYGLKQTPRTWNIKIDLYFHHNIFEKSQYEPSLYMKKKERRFSNGLSLC